MPAKIFISSSSDTRDERRSAIKLIDRLGEQLKFELGGDHPQAYAYERDGRIGQTAAPIQNMLLRAGDREVELVVCILGERIGYPLTPETVLPPEVEALARQFGAWLALPNEVVKYPDKTPLTGVLFEILDAVANNRRIVFMCKGDRGIFDASESDQRRRGFGDNQYEMQYRKARSEGVGPALSPEQTDYLSRQRQGIQRLYDLFFPGHSTKKRTFLTLDEFEAALEQELREHWRDEAAVLEARGIKGLAPFNIADADVFFGRTSEVQDLLAALGDQARGSQSVPMMVLEGRSGVGKSSFLAAGLAAAVLHPDPAAGALIPGARLRPVLTSPSDLLELVKARREEERAAGVGASHPGDPSPISAGEIVWALAGKISEQLPMPTLQQDLQYKPLKEWSVIDADQALKRAIDYQELEQRQGERLRPLVLIDQMEEALSDRAFETRWVPVIQALDAVCRRRHAWAVIAIADTARIEEEGGWLARWNGTQAIQRLAATGSLKPWRLLSLSPNQMIDIFKGILKRNAVNLNPHAERYLLQEFHGALTNPAGAGFEPDAALALASVSIQLSDERRRKRIHSLFSSRASDQQQGRAKPRLAPLGASEQDIPFHLEDQERELKFEDVVALDKAIETLAEQTFEDFVEEDLGLVWRHDPGEPPTQAPREATRLLESIFRWLTDLNAPDFERTPLADLWRHVAPRSVRRSHFRKRNGLPADLLVARLQNSRLVRAEKQELVRVSHVALFRYWPRAAEWLRMERRLLDAHRSLQDYRYQSGRRDNFPEPSVAELAAWRELYSAWGIRGPWRTELRGPQGNQQADFTWLKARLNQAALAATSVEEAANALWAALRAGDDDGAAGQIRNIHARKIFRDALDAKLSPLFDRRQPPPIVVAAENGLSQSLRLLSKCSRRPFARDVNGQSALHKLAARGDADGLRTLAKLLKSSQAPGKGRWPPAALADKGWTPLHLAAKSGSIATVSEVVAMLLKGSDRTLPQLARTMRQLGGSTALHFAARHGPAVSPDMIRAILALGKDVPTAADERGFLPVHYAIENDDAASVELLLRSGARTDLFARTRRLDLGELHTPLSLAARRGAEKSVAILLQEGVIQKGGWEFGREALRLAAGYGHTAVIELLLGGTKRPMADLLKNHDEFGRNALHLAAQFRHSEAARAILAHEGGRAVVAFQDKVTGRTALHWAAWHPDIREAKRIEDTIRMLLSSGSPADIRDADGLTPFLLALRNRVRPAYRTLFECEAAAGLDANAIFEVLQSKDEDFIRSFLLTCADEQLEVEDSEGRSVLERASFLGMKSVAEEILRRRPGLRDHRDRRERNALHHACTSHSPQSEGIIGLLLRSGVRADSIDGDGRLPLHYAAFNSPIATRSLVEAAGDSLGAALGTKDRFGKTCLHSAAEAGSPEIVRLLLKLGADASEPTVDGRRPLHIAAYYGCLAAIKELASAGGSDAIALRDDSGETVLHSAAAGGQPEVVRWLFETYPNEAADCLTISGHERGVTPLGLALIRWSKEIAREPSEDEAGASEETSQSTVARAWRVVEMLIAAAPRKFGNRLPDDPGILFAAVTSGDEAVLSQMIDAGAPTFGPPGTRFSAIHKAVELGDVRLAQRLLDLAPLEGVRATNRLGRTPLHLACRLGLSDLLQPFLERGADPLAVDANGRTPADLALLNGKDQTLTELLRLMPPGVEPFGEGVIDRQTNDTLHKAAREDNASAVRDALRRNPDPDMRVLAISLACRWGATKVLRELLAPDFSPLLQKNAEGDIPIIDALRFRHDNVLELLSDDVLRPQAGFDLGGKQDLLHIASKFGALESCARLIGLGFDPYRRDGAERASIHLAAMHLHPAVVDLLLQHRLTENIDAVDVIIRTNGRTALHCAAGVETNGDQKRADRKRQVVQRLLEKGADPAVTDDLGQTPAQISRDVGDVVTADLLASSAAVETGRLSQTSIWASLFGKRGTARRR